MSQLDDSQVKRLLQEATRIAVLGASDDPARDSHRIFTYLQGQGYEVIPVNPMADEVAGVECVSTLEEAGPVDIVDVFRRSEHVAAIVDDVIRLKLPALWLQLRIHDADAEAKARDAGITLVTDRCIMVEHRRLLG